MADGWVDRDESIQLIEISINSLSVLLEASRVRGPWLSPGSYWGFNLYHTNYPRSSRGCVLHGHESLDVKSGSEVEAFLGQ